MKERLKHQLFFEIFWFVRITDAHSRDKVIGTVLLVGIVHCIWKCSRKAKEHYKMTADFRLEFNKEYLNALDANVRLSRKNGG